MPIFPQLADSRLDHFFLFARFILAMIIKTVMQAAVPAITPHQKSGMYMLSPPARAAPQAFYLHVAKDY